MDLRGKLRLKIAHGFAGIVRSIGIRGTTKAAHFISKLLLPKPSGKILITTVEGFDIYIDPLRDLGVERSIYYTGTMEPGTVSNLKSLISISDTIIDVGANIGFLSIIFSKLVGENGKILSFEPLESTRKLFIENIGLNSLKNINVFECALGSRADNLPIFPHGKNRGMASLMKHDSDNGIPAENISVKTLDSIIGIENKIKLIKIDAEGWELEVLKGSPLILKNKDAPILCIECCTLRSIHGGTLADLFRLLCLDNTYKLYKSKKGMNRICKMTQINSINDFPDFDNILCFPSNHYNLIPSLT